MKRIVIVMAALVLAGCAKQAETTATVGAGGVEVSRLFRHDGCTVYRFIDAGNYRYFSKCGDASEVFWSETHSCGKACTRTESHSVPTSRAAAQKGGA